MGSLCFKGHIPGGLS